MECAVIYLLMTALVAAAKPSNMLFMLMDDVSSMPIRVKPVVHILSSFRATRLQ